MQNHSNQLAIWTISYDNGGGLRYHSDVGTSVFDYDSSNHWHSSFDSGSTWHNGQSGVDTSYAFDPTTLPTNSGDSGATSDGLSWPCDWSQYSVSCTPTSTPTSTPLSSSDVLRSLGSLNLGLAIISTILFVFLITFFFNMTSDKRKKY